VELPAPKHLRVAPKVSRRVLRQRRRARWAVAGLAAISVASMFLLVTFHVFAVQSSFQLDKLEQQRSAAQRRNELLRNQVAKRSSATTIFNAAIALGMRRPPQTILVKVSGGDATLPKQERATVRMPPTDYGSIAAAP
jgi:cell division protein FtsL